MNWKVFKREDPNTWPKVDCPLFVCWTNGKRHKFYDARWDTEAKRFMHDWRWIFFEKEGDIFYVSIGYIPYIERETHPMKCITIDSACEYEDDGYCLFDGFCTCQKEITEYMIGYKRIWKEFGED